MEHNTNPFDDEVNKQAKEAKARQEALMTKKNKHLKN
jgi:hypothetical protein